MAVVGIQSDLRRRLVQDLSSQAGRPMYSGKKDPTMKNIQIPNDMPYTKYTLSVCVYIDHPLQKNPKRDRCVPVLAQMQRPRNNTYTRGNRKGIWTMLALAPILSCSRSAVTKTMKNSHRSASEPDPRLDSGSLLPLAQSSPTMLNVTL